MTKSTNHTIKPMRRVRPWIAGLLTMFGWGIGLYYARKTRAAILVVTIQIFATVLIAALIMTHLVTNGPVTFPAMNPNGFSLVDVFNIIFTLFVAIGVFVFVRKQDQYVEKSSPVRLLGYVGIWIIPAILSILIALTIRFFLFQPFNIPAGSMSPTLQVGEFFAVNKMTYGYSRASLVYPFTRMSIEGRVLNNSPRRGDVVVFKNIKDDNKDYVKRLIGLPGDEIHMIRGHLHINGEPVQKEFVGMVEAICDGLSAEFPAYVETLDNGVSYFVHECHGDKGRLDNVGPYKVPEEHYFMLGDNRDQSQDSRIIFSVGFVHHDNLVGKAMISKRTG